MSVPYHFWEPLTRAAVLGQLGWVEEAQPNLENLFQVQPVFETRDLELMCDQLHSDENVEMLLDGLRKAGLELEE